MTRELWIAGLALALGGVLEHELFPRPPVLTPVPSIVTIHDTVRTTVRLQGPRVVTTDTVNLIARVTIHDTVQINVGADTAARARLWPVLALQVAPARGDTSEVTTVDLRSGVTAVSRLWTPGPLRSLWVTDQPTPRLEFDAPPAPRAVSLWTKGKWAAIGYGARALQCLLSRC